MEEVSMDVIQRIPAVLIVDDEEIVRELLVRAVSDFFSGKRSFTCQQAGNADEALSILEKSQFDLIFMDVRMPGPLDGVGLTQLVRAKEQSNSRTPARIICITGLQTQEEGNRALQAGADCCVFKPFSMQRIFDELTKKFGR